MVMMKPISNLLTVFGVLSIFLVLISHKAVKAASKKPIQESNHNPVLLCLPGIYYRDPGDCKPVSPSASLTRMTEFKSTFPLIPYQQIKQIQNWSNPIFTIGKWSRKTLRSIQTSNQPYRDEGSSHLKRYMPDLFISRMIAQESRRENIYTKQEEVG